MIGDIVLHCDKLAMVLHSRIFPVSGKMLAIQYLQSTGEPYTLKERKRMGIEQYIFVPESEVVECAEVC